MSDAARPGQVQTVLGPLSPENLGPTTTHEHILIDFSCMFHPPAEASERQMAYAPVTMENLGWIRYDPFGNLDNLQVLNEEEAIAEVERYGRFGGGTMVDATTIGIGRDPLALTRISRATGVNVVMGAGYYVGVTHPDDLDDMTVDDVARQIVAEVKDGVGDTGVRSGIIGELGCTWPLEDNERKVLVAAAHAQGETGASILIHPGRDPRAPFEILDILGEAGADVARVVMGHIDRTVMDTKVVLELAERGSFLEYDLFGWEISHYPLAEWDMISDAQRLDYVQALLAEGYGDRLVLAQDVFCKSRTVAYGGMGFAHILEHIVPRMLARGVTREQVDTMLVENPRKILTLV